MKPKEIEKRHQDLLTSLGKRITELRKEKGLTYKQMAEKIGISRNAYNLVENGNVYFNISTLLIILDFHGIELKDFFKGL